jgi:hypothetical protein
MVAVVHASETVLHKGHVGEIDGHHNGIFRA